MTTSQSPLRAIKAQADTIAKALKAFERGEKIENIQFAERLIAARGKPKVKFAIAMDDKIVSIEMPWRLIRETTEVGLSEFIVKQMREERDH